MYQKIIKRLNDYLEERKLEKDREFLEKYRFEYKDNKDGSDKLIDIKYLLNNGDILMINKQNRRLRGGIQQITLIMNQSNYDVLLPYLTILKSHLSSMNFFDDKHRIYNTKTKHQVETDLKEIIVYGLPTGLRDDFIRLIDDVALGDVENGLPVIDIVASNLSFKRLDTGKLEFTCVYDPEHFKTSFNKTQTKGN